MDEGLKRALTDLGKAVDARDAKAGEPVTPIHATVRISEKVGLAHTYWEDGAPFSAARCLSEAAAIALAHGLAVNAEMAREMADG